MPTLKLHSLKLSIILLLISSKIPTVIITLLFYPKLSWEYYVNEAPLSLKNTILLCLTAFLQT